MGCCVSTSVVAQRGDFTTKNGIRPSHLEKADWAARSVVLGDFQNQVNQLPPEMESVRASTVEPTAL